MDETQKSVSIWPAHHVKLRSKPKVLFVFLWLLDMSEDGEKVKDVVKFCDTAEAIRLMSLFTRWLPSHNEA